MTGACSCTTGSDTATGSVSLAFRGRVNEAGAESGGNGSDPPELPAESYCLRADAADFDRASSEAVGKALASASGGIGSRAVRTTG